MPQSPKEVDAHPDGWRRFESAVDAALRSAPKHRTAKKPKTKKPAK